MSTVAPIKAWPSKIRKDLNGEPLEFKDHQIEAIRWLLRNGSGLLYMSPGLGKSLSALTATAVLFDSGRAERVLVICTADIKGNWLEMIEDATYFSAHILDGDPRQRAVQLAEFDSEILIINYQQVHPHMDELIRLGFDVVYVDESQAIKNAGIKTTKAVLKLRSNLPRARWYPMTATPVENTQDEIWAQMKLVEGPDMPLYSYWQWRTRMCRLGGFQNKTVVGIKRERQGDYRKMMKRYSFQRTMDECTDLPKSKYVMVNVDLSPLQQELYAQIETDLIEEFRDAEEREKASALTAALRLTQLCSTSASIPIDPEDPDGPHHPDESVKLDTVVANIVKLASEGEKNVVFAKFIDTLDAIERRLAEHGLPVFRIDGSVKNIDRQPIVREWRNHSGPSVLIGTFGTIGKGHTFTAASNSHMVELLFTSTKMDQADGRTRRLGMNPLKPATIWEYVCTGTYEDRIIDILKRKRKMITEDVATTKIEEKTYQAQLFDAIFQTEMEDA